MAFSHSQTEFLNVRHKMLLQTLTLVWFFCAGIFGARLPPPEIEIGDVLKAVENGLNFFSEDYSNINVDGLFGLRLGQGQIREALRECRERSCDEELLRNLTSVSERLGTACDSALPYVEAEDSAYYNRFISTINSPYVLPYSPIPFEENDDITVGTHTNYDEELGDICFSRILGTFEENGKLLPQCNMTNSCWDYMNTDMTAGYTITHQLLYFILIEHVGCREAVEAFVGNVKIRDIQKNLCNKIYAEAKTFEEEGKVKAMKHDLFLEQTVLCGPLGFESFMRSDWMKMVLTWPDKNDGCFKLDLVEYLIDNELYSEKQRRNQHEERKPSMTMRKLLREKEMKDGCLSHTSGLGFGVLCTYLRYLLRVM